jgi:multiple sugar transport system ATP-binding protein
MNLITTQIDERVATIGGATIGLTPAQRSALTSDQITVGLRPESLVVQDAGGIAATVDTVEELGSDAFVYCTSADGDQIVARVPGLSSIRPEMTVSLSPVGDGVHRFDTATGLRLPD